MPRVEIVITISTVTNSVSISIGISIGISTSASISISIVSHSHLARRATQALGLTASPVTLVFLLASVGVIAIASATLHSTLYPLSSFLALPYSLVLPPALALTFLPTCLAPAAAHDPGRQACSPPLSNAQFSYWVWVLCARARVCVFEFAALRHSGRARGQVNSSVCRGRRGRGWMGHRECTFARADTARVRDQSDGIPCERRGVESRMGILQLGVLWLTLVTGV